MLVLAVGGLALGGCTVNPDASPLTGEWVGTYTCSQGLTGLTLDMTGHQNGAVDAVFMFYAVPENPGVPTGTFRMHGVYMHGRELRLDPVEWISQPAGWHMVGLLGTISADLSTYSGYVAGSTGCTTFSVTRG
jgi:hypothetical protein